MQSDWPQDGEAPPARDPGFASDLASALGVWAAHPLLPTLTLGIAAASSIPGGAGGLVAVAASLFGLGFWGTQRIWYLRAYRGQAISPREIWSMSWDFLWRFLLLGILFAIPLAVAFAMSVWLSEGREPDIARLLLYLLPLVIVFDVCGTFVVPALSYATRSVRSAIREGVAMLRAEWPACLWYALAPPLAASAAGFGVLEPVVGRTAATLVAISVGNLLNLWFKGAIALFYLRRNPWVPADGSARS